MRNDSAMMLMMFLPLALPTTLGLWGCSVADAHDAPAVGTCDDLRVVGV